MHHIQSRASPADFLLFSASSQCFPLPWRKTTITQYRDVQRRNIVALAPVQGDSVHQILRQFRIGAILRYMMIIVLCSSQRNGSAVNLPGSGTDEEKNSAVKSYSPVINRQEFARQRVGFLISEPVEPKSVSQFVQYHRISIELSFTPIRHWRRARRWVGIEPERAEVDRIKINLDVGRFPICIIPCSDLLCRALLANMLPIDHLGLERRRHQAAPRSARRPISNAEHNLYGARASLEVSCPCLHSSRDVRANCRLKRLELRWKRLHSDLYRNLGFANAPYRENNNEKERLHRAFISTTSPSVAYFARFNFAFAPDVLRAIAARMSALNAAASTSSPSWMSIARLTFPSRLELKSF